MVGKTQTDSYSTGAETADTERAYQMIITTENVKAILRILLDSEDPEIESLLRELVKQVNNDIKYWEMDV